MPISLLNNIRALIGVSVFCAIVFPPGFGFAEYGDSKLPVPAVQKTDLQKSGYYKEDESENQDNNITGELSLEAFQDVNGDGAGRDPAVLFDPGEAEAATLAIRRDSQKEAALSYGARGGLLWRSKQISEKMEKQSVAMDNAFDFRQLLIKAPTNLLIEPPIIHEAVDALLVDGTGQEAAVADTIYNISKQAKIVTAPRTWRDYLYRTTDIEDETILPPPSILLPENPQEKLWWRKWVAVGWRQGIEQADAIFQMDIERLTADYKGMVRYRVLLAEGKVSPPFAVLEDRGITGGGREMRVGDRAIRITGPSQLKASEGGQTWTPGMR